MSNKTRSSLQLHTSGALTSHSPLYFASQPQARSEMTRPAASRLVYISNWKLTSESAKNEPKLRQLLGHLAVFESTSTFTQTTSNTPLSPISESESDPNELSIYLNDHVPSFKQFQAAIAEQIATMAQVSSAAAQLTVNEYQSDEEEDDSDYDSYDGDDWSDDEGAAESDGSLTDNEGSEDQSTDAISPISSSCQEEEDADLWAIRPLTSLLTRTPVTCS